ncbi:MAG: hypothetical protein K2K68_11190 [Duncaniella sp.]|nr:hypothetical protein [Duncaniella sp.]
MRKFLIVLLAIAAMSLPFVAKGDGVVSLGGRVKDAVVKMDLPNAFILWPDSSGTKVDSISCKSKSWRNGEILDASFWHKEVPRVDSTYVFDVVCEGYMPQTVSFTVEKLGKRESFREVPLIYLERAPHQLKEVTVTASKIKFYNKGDTLVFNADAFQLAEGSMLDGLIAQLPGVELNDDGQIKVNGQFVESLLLNGREFLDGNNQLMLENIAAYTVKNVEVYQGQDRKEKWTRDDSGVKHLTMDVKLKKEYNMGWLVNAQAGIGTEDRYSGRLFAQWFTPTQRLILLGNVNNLNDNRKPGKADTWTPDMMPDGTRRYHLASGQYSYTNLEETVDLTAAVKFEQLRTNDMTTMSQTNFLGNTNTYEYSYARSHMKDTKLNSNVDLWLRNGKVAGYLDLVANYRRKTNDGNTLAATFDDEQKEMDREVIETLYTDADPERLGAVINRSVTRTDGSMRQVDLRATPGGSLMLGSGDRLSFETYFRYNNQKEERWNDYTVNYGTDAMPAVRRRQYFDNSPNHIITSVNNLTYRMKVNKVRLALNYEYRFSDNEKDSYMYALERLEDMGMYGVLPGSYLDAFDPANSYTSRLIENKHSLEPSLNYTWGNDKLNIYANMYAQLSLKHQHLDYWRDGRSYLVRQTNFIVTSGRWRTYVDFSFGPERNDNGKRKEFKHMITYHIEIDPTTPDPFHRLDVINDADPLNITVGNPDLCTSYNINNRITYFYEPSQPRHPIYEEFTVRYVTVTDALTRGYIYDTATGVRTTRTYNVDGNNTASLENTLRLQFGRANQFTLASVTDASLQHYADMIGVDMQAPQKSVVSNLVMGQKLDFTWQIGKQSITARGSFTGRRTTSDRDDFSTINARHVSYGVIGNFRLPAGFGISTDFMVYNRRGYGVAEIDRSDLIWNARLSYNPPFARRWVFMLDGFDMLHQLSNVNYAVNAAGRTVSYSNALPRYVMLSVQYRFNHQPKKRGK